MDEAALILGTWLRSNWRLIQAYITIRNDLFSQSWMEYEI